MKQQCTWCNGDYKVKKNGELYSHGCWKYTGGTIEYGPLDRLQRGAAEAVPVAMTSATVTAPAPEPVAEVVRVRPVAGPPITPALIRALQTVRNNLHGMSTVVTEAVNALDNAGIFAAIDEATGYDVDPEPERVSKCVCPDELGSLHRAGCPGDPAEWGDMAYTTAPVEAEAEAPCSCPKAYATAPASSQHSLGCQLRAGRSRMVRASVGLRW